MVYIFWGYFGQILGQTDLLQCDQFKVPWVTPLGNLHHVNFGTVIYLIGTTPCYMF